MLAGAAIIYKTRFQSTVALSSTKAEFVAASNARKLALYLHSLHNELVLDHKEAILLYKANAGAFMMSDLHNKQGTSIFEILRYSIGLSRTLFALSKSPQN